jgi:hypothetical protein
VKVDSFLINLEMIALLIISAASARSRMLHFQVSFLFCDEGSNFDFERSEILDCSKDTGHRAWSAL